jgi:ABC-type branched-subunit amino acid transport system substrate-binding protein
VAFFYLQGGNQVLSSAFPGSSVSFGNGQAEAQAVVNDVNDHGGVNGRKLAPYFVAVQATAASDADLEQDCKAAVDDDHPLVILSMFNLGTDEASCAAQTHTLVIVVALGAGDKVVYEQGQNYAFTPSQLSRDAESVLLLTLAHNQNRISPATKVGILSESDDPMYDRVATSTMAPLLKSWKVPYVQADFDPSQLSEISAAVLQFKTDGVSTVIFSCGSGGIPEVLFMQAAAQQGYTPKYLMGDSTDPSFVASAAPRAQASNIWGAGTMPLADVTTSQYPTTPTEQHCLNVMNSSFGAGYSNRGSSLTATLYCELVYSFVSVAEKVQGPLSAASWVAAYRTFGTGYTPVTTFGTDFAGNDFSASEYRELAWNGTCSCISYTSPIRPIPSN